MELEAESDDSYINYLYQPSTDVKISVLEGINRGSGLSNYVGYVIKVEKPLQITVERRYREFFALREVLLQRWPGIYIPVLPRKHTSGNSSLKIVNERVKYLTYFLNCIAKINFIFMSDEFQLFLTSNISDLKKAYEKMERIKYQQIVERYVKEFPQQQPKVQNKQEYLNSYKQIVEPFHKQISQVKISLINIKKQLYKLAIKRQDELKATAILYNEALPSFENYMMKSSQNCKIIFQTNQQLKQKLTDIRIQKAVGLWVLYQSIRLQILQSDGILDVFNRKTELERQEQRIRRKIIDNQQQIKDIQLKKISLKQIFSKNNEQLLKDLQRESVQLKEEIAYVEKLNYFALNLLSSLLVKNYNKQRQMIWKRAWRFYLGSEIQANTTMSNLYESLYKS